VTSNWQAVSQSLSLVGGVIMMVVSYRPLRHTRSRATAIMTAMYASGGILCVLWPYQYSHWLDLTTGVHGLGLLLTSIGSSFPVSLCFAFVWTIGDQWSRRLYAAYAAYLGSLALIVALWAPARAVAGSDLYTTVVGSSGILVAYNLAVAISISYAGALAFYAFTRLPDWRRDIPTIVSIGVFAAAVFYGVSVGALTFASDAHIAIPWLMTCLLALRATGAIIMGLCSGHMMVVRPVCEYVRKKWSLDEQERRIWERECTLVALETMVADDLDLVLPYADRSFVHRVRQNCESSRLSPYQRKVVVLLAQWISAGRGRLSTVTWSSLKEEDRRSVDDDLVAEAEDRAAALEGVSLLYDLYALTVRVCGRPDAIGEEPRTEAGTRMRDPAWYDEAIALVRSELRTYGERRYRPRPFNLPDEDEGEQRHA